MLLHILKLIKTQRRSNTWVFIELLVVFVLLLVRRRPDDDEPDNTGATDGIFV